MALRPVQRIKHVVDVSATIAAAAQLNTAVVTAKDAPVLSNTAEVVTGSKVYGLYIKVLMASNEATVGGAIPNVYLAVWKNPGGNLAAIGLSSVGANDNKRFVFHQEMSMITNQISAAPTVLFDGVVKIPKGFSRMGPNDIINVSVVSITVNVSFCMQVHYKEFR